MRARAVAAPALAAVAIVGCQLLGSIDAKPLAVANDAASTVSVDSSLSCESESVMCRNGVPSRCTLGEWKPSETCSAQAFTCSRGACVSGRGLALGAHFTCALTRDARVRCSGDNTDGELGDGTTKDRKDPVYVEGLTNVADVTAGPDFACAITSTQAVQCWGHNLFGELGDPSTTTYYRPRAGAVPGLEDVLDVALGTAFGCALRKDAVVCWGTNGYGQLGDGTFERHTAPSPVVGLPAPAAQIAAGDGFVCAVLASGGDVLCWGANESGQLGDGSRKASGVPKRVLGLAPVKRVASHGSRACAVLRDGTVWCWGGSDADAGAVPSPRMVDGLTDVADVRLGAEHACALGNVAVLSCWGDDLYGQLGRDRKGPRYAAAPIVDLSVVVAFELGRAHTCARDGSGNVFCWGHNDAGQLGDGTTTSQYRPTPVLQ